MASLFSHATSVLHRHPADRPGEARKADEPGAISPQLRSSPTGKRILDMAGAEAPPARSTAFPRQENALPWQHLVPRLQEGRLVMKSDPHGEDVDALIGWLSDPDCEVHALHVDDELFDEDRKIASLAQAIMENRSLTSLSLGVGLCDAKRYAALAYLLESRPGLQSLRLMCAGSVGIDRCKPFIDVLRNNGTVASLEFQCVAIEDSSLSALFDALAGNRCLDRLVIHSFYPISVSADTADALQKLLCSEAALRKVIVSMSKVDGPGTIDMLRALAGPNRLTSLHMGCLHPLGNEPVNAFAVQLAKNEALRELVINHAPGSLEWAEALSPALKRNHVLEALSICEWGKDGAGDKLAEALKFNRGVRKLRIRGEAPCLADIEALNAMLDHNSTLTSLDLGNFPLSRTVAGSQALHQLQEKLERNRRLQDWTDGAAAYLHLASQGALPAEICTLLGEQLPRLAPARAEDGIATMLAAGREMDWPPKSQ